MRPRLSSLLALAVGVLTWCVQVRAQAPDEVAAQAPARPKIGLVLSGGGARGLAHIGVLRVLREQRIPIDVIASTSMGAIVGGAYAAGLSVDEIQAAVFDLDWAGVFSGRLPRADLHWRRKLDDGRNLSKFEFGIDSGGLRLPSGAVGGHEIERFLRHLTASVQHVENLRRLPIPFVAMATDLETGATVALSDVPLSQAMRASMSIPGAFAPVEVDGSLLVDGGLVANLPVQAARRLGADIVIAVNVGTPLAPRPELGTAMGVAQQMINILTEQNVAAARRELRPNDVLIEPVFGRTTLADFSKASQIIALGERAARDALERLRPLAVQADAYAAFEARRRASVAGEAPVRVTEVRVEGLVRTNPATVAAEMELPSDRYLSGEEIRAKVDALNAEGKFERVDYRLVTIGAGRVLVVHPVEKSWGPNTLRLGGLASSDFRQENTFNVVAAHTLTDVNRLGGEWRNEVQLGNATMLMTDLYQPLAPGSRWFVLPRLLARRASADVFDGDNVVGRRQSSMAEASIHFGHTFARYGYASLGRTEGRVKTETVIAPAPQPAVYADSDRWTALFLVDRLDSYAFPKHGYALAGEIDRFDRDAASASASRLTAANLLAAWTSGRHTLLLNAYSVRASGNGAGYQLGGFLNLSGTPRGRLAGAKTLFVGLIGYREVTDLFGETPAPIYLGVSLETGNSDDASDALAWDRLKRAGALFVAADTLAGPLYFGYGHTAGGRSALYLFWGLFWGRF